MSPFPHPENQPLAKLDESVAALCLISVCLSTLCDAASHVVAHAASPAALLGVQNRYERNTYDHEHLGRWIPVSLVIGRVEKAKPRLLTKQKCWAVS